jgi:uncharacterized phage protein gp47/JayE
MIARVVARSDLTGLTRNASIFHLIAASASEDAEQYFQMSRLRDLFAIDKATGSDLDARAAEIVPGTIQRREALKGSTTEVFSRPGIVGTTAIPSGSIVAASDAQGQIKFQTTAAGSILAGSTDSAPIPVVAIEAGTRGNVAAGSINQFVSRIAGVTTATNGTAVTNAQDRESDAAFRARIRAYVQALSRATPTAIESFANNVTLTDGRRVLFANLKEPIIPDGTVQLYIDDGTGNVEEFDDTYITTPEVVISSAVGGEVQAFSGEKPIRDDGSFILEVDTGGGYVVQVNGADYDFNAAQGKVVFTAALGTGDAVRMTYRYYTGLIQETQKVVDGDPLNPLVYPGVRAGGTQVYVLPPTLVLQSVAASISVLGGFDTTTVAAEVATVVQDYINNLPIGADVIVSEIIERSMAVTGMFNFRFQTLTGSAPPADQVILDDQVARITAANITLV